MENVRELLTNALNPQARLMAETRGLVSKWEKTGLLEGLRNDIEKSNMSVLLENQAKQGVSKHYWQRRLRFVRPITLNFVCAFPISPLC